MKFSKAALIAALATSGSVIAAGAPASAQQKQTQPARPAQGQAAPAQAPAAAPGTAAAQPQRQYTLSREERAALAPLLALNTAALNAPAGTANWAGVAAGIPAVQAVARSTDAIYLLARVQLAVALNTNNGPMQDQALDTLIASTATPASELPPLLNVRAERSFAANDFAGAERAFQRLLQLNPEDARIINNLAIVRQRLGNTNGALEIILQNIQTQEANGGRATEDLYRRARDLVYTSADKTRAVELAQRLAQNYPTVANWRDAIRIYQEVRNPDASTMLDSMRFARAAGSLNGEGDYLSFAQVLDQAGLPGEAKAVLDEGIQRGAFSATRQGVPALVTRTNGRIAQDRAGLAGQITQARSGATANLARSVADALYGYGRYAEAADLYRAALTKTGADRNLLNLRLGAALAMAGQRAEAEAALRSVNGPSTDLARLWLAWLGRRAA
jgi:tetratricopeptide (TPR) repeat protein